MIRNFFAGVGVAALVLLAACVPTSLDEVSLAAAATVEPVSVLQPVANNAVGDATPMPSLVAEKAETAVFLPTISSNHPVTLRYTLDRTAVPPVTYPDLTLKIFVGEVNQVKASDANGQRLATSYDPDTGFLLLTVTTDWVDVTLTGAKDIANAGRVEKTTLKDDKAWAWSHGFDDNFFLKAAMAHFTAKGWTGSLFMIAKDVQDNRREDWTIDAPDLRDFLAQGWAIGSHTWGHECFVENPDYRQTVLDGYHRLAEVVATSMRPDYRIVSFAAPCFDANYHPLILQMRDAKETAVLFNESGAGFRMVVDPAVSEAFVVEEKTAVAFNYDLPVGRDARIESELPNVLAEIDWMAANSSATRHLWYNTLAHGGHEDAIKQVVDHVYNNYGPGGTDEVWVAPSDEIYSYLLVRDKTAVRWEIVNP
jgi:hypothetical protein